MQQPQRPAEIEERRQEQDAQGQPHVQGVDVPAERAGVAAGHRPRHLKAGPLFGHAPGQVVDDHEPDLLLAALGEVADLPLKGPLQIGVGERAGVFAAQRAHLGQPRGDCERLIG